MTQEEINLLTKNIVAHDRTPLSQIVNNDIKKFAQLNQSKDTLQINTDNKTNLENKTKEEQKSKEAEAEEEDNNNNNNNNKEDSQLEPKSKSKNSKYNDTDFILKEILKTKASNNKLKTINIWKIYSQNQVSEVNITDLKNKNDNSEENTKRQQFSESNNKGTLINKKQA